VRILYVSQYYPPEMGAPAVRVSQLAQRWVSEGHDVTVLTGFPNHPTGKVAPGYRQKLWRLVYPERREGVRVVRTWLLPLPNRKARERVLNYASFAASAALVSTFIGKHDIVVATSPQLLVGLVGWWHTRIYRTPFVFEVRDLWPESLVASGMGQTGSRFIRVLDRIASFLYRRADLIVTVSPAMRDQLVQERSIPPEKVTVVLPGVETDLFRPLQASRELRREFDLEGRFVAAYIGTLGMAHGLGVLLDAAEALQDRTDVTFLLVGEGAEKDKLVREATRRNLTNVRFLPQQPHERIPEILALADVCLVLLRDSDLFRTVLPTKTFEYMACGKPVIINVDGQARRVVEEGKAGLYVPPGDAGGLMTALEKLRADEALRRSLGSQARTFVEQHYSRQTGARDFLRFFVNLKSRAGSKG